MLLGENILTLSLLLKRALILYVFRATAPKIAIQDHLFFLYKNLQTNYHTIMAGC